METNTELKFCKFCCERIAIDAVICPKCGRQIEELKNNYSDRQIVINNSNNAAATASAVATASVPQTIVTNQNAKNKWIALILCLFLGYWGAHKFYEGKTLLGFLYLFTLGFCGIGAFIDLIILLFKPNPYYV